jgi:hypothetical protein
MDNDTILTTCRAICESYQHGDATLRRRLRILYPRMTLEFDAIERCEDRAQRTLARQALTPVAAAPAVVEQVVVRRVAQR